MYIPVLPEPFIEETVFIPLYAHAFFVKYQLTIETWVYFWALYSVPMIYVSVLMLEIYPRNPETPIQNNICTPVFIVVLFTIAKLWKQHQHPSVGEWIKKLWYIYTMEYYTAEKKKEFLPFTTAWIELETIMLIEISQLVKDKCHMISFISGLT